MCVCKQNYIFLRLFFYRLSETIAIASSNFLNPPRLRQSCLRSELSSESVSPSGRNHRLELCRINRAKFSVRRDRPARLRRGLVSGGGGEGRNRVDWGRTSIWQLTSVPPRDSLPPSSALAVCVDGGTIRDGRDDDSGARIKRIKRITRFYVCVYARSATRLAATADRSVASRSDKQFATKEHLRIP